MVQPIPSSDDAFKDSMNFVKKLWGGMNIPGMNSSSGIPTMQGMGMPIPTMSVEDLDKRIQELKSVEAWLNVNVSMLHSTIQALEIQRATIATLHSLSSTMSSTMAQTMQGLEANSEKANINDDKKSDDASADVSPLIAQSAAWWNAVQEQFKQALGTALASSATSGQTEQPVTKNEKTPAAKTTAKTASKAKPAAPSKSRKAS